MKAEAAPTRRISLPSICRRRIPIKCKSGITLSFCFREQNAVRHPSPPFGTPTPGGYYYSPVGSTRHWHRIRMQFVLPQLILFMSLGYKYICEIAYLCRRCSFRLPLYFSYSTALLFSCCAPPHCEKLLLLFRSFR